MINYCVNGTISMTEDRHKRCLTNLVNKIPLISEFSMNEL